MKIRKAILYIWFGSLRSSRDKCFFHQLYYEKLQSRAPRVIFFVLVVQFVSALFDHVG